MYHIVNIKADRDVTEIHGYVGAGQYPFKSNSSIDEESTTAGETKEETNYRLIILADFVQRLRKHIFSHVPYNLVEDVTNKVKTKDSAGSN